VVVEGVQRGSKEIQQGRTLAGSLRIGMDEGWKIPESSRAIPCTLNGRRLLVLRKPAQFVLAMPLDR
jgi:hypothetical protein